MAVESAIIQGVECHNVQFPAPADASSLDDPPIPILIGLYLQEVHPAYNELHKTHLMSPTVLAAACRHSGGFDILASSQGTKKWLVRLNQWL